MAIEGCVVRAVMQNQLRAVDTGHSPLPGTGGGTHIDKWKFMSPLQREI